MNIDASKIKQIIANASNIIIMAHKNLDLDALGSSLGMYYIAKYFDKSAYILIDDKVHEVGVSRSLKQLKERNLNINIKSFHGVKDIVDNNTVLIILDVHIGELVQNKDILELTKNIILVDHHVVDEKSIKTTSYEFIDENKSSTAEIVIDLLKELDVYIPSYIATVMLAGIVIDTNSFYQKTAGNTYDAAAFLAKQGADNGELQYLLKENLDKYLKRQKIISNVEVINDIFAIAIGDDERCNKEDLAKISDTLLSFDDIEAAFTIGHIDSKTVGISARSLGGINVQRIMEQLDGGGHTTDAATQLENISLHEAKDKLLKIIYNI